MKSASSILHIGNRAVGPGFPCLVVAEIAQAHDGSLGTAHAYIDAVANVGCEAIKFQTHIAAAESTPGEPWRVQFSRQDATRYDYWRRMEFSEEQWLGLFAHAKERGLIFLASPFSREAASLLSRVGVPAWKVGAGELSNFPLIDQMAKTKLPVILSSGLAGWEDLDVAVARVRACQAPVAVLQCTTSYPCPPEKLGLNLISELANRYNCPVGLSDHSGTGVSGVAAAALGAHLVEVHVVFSRDCFGPDVKSSITVAELGELVRNLQFLHRALSNPVDKQKMADELSELRRVFAKSVVAARDLPVGHRLAEDDLTLKKPGTGLPAARLGDLIGRRLCRPLAADMQVTEDALES